MKFERRVFSSTASGHELSFPIYTFKGSGSGKKVYIQANMHGAENQGNAVIAELLKHFKKNAPLGEVTLVPFANPLGMDQKHGTQTIGRYNPNDGENYNRGYQDLASEMNEKLLRSKVTATDSKKALQQFRELLAELCQEKEKELAEYGASYNEKLCLKLQALAHQADIVLDLHTDTHSLEHLYSANYALKSAETLGFPVIYNIPTEFAGALDEAAFLPWELFASVFKKRNPFLAFTLELGDEENWNSKLAREQSKRILYFLGKQGVVAEIPPKPTSFKQSQSAKLAKLKRYKAPVGGNLEFFKKPGERVSAGTPVAKIYNFSERGLEAHCVEAKASGLLMARIKSSSCHQGLTVFQVLED